jgi:hypothetical protein
VEIFCPGHARRPPLFETKLYHYCRDERFGRHKNETGNETGPADNLRDALCNPGCRASFYRRHCFVCEREMERKTEQQLLCGRPKCVGEFQRHRERFLGKWGEVPGKMVSPSENPANTHHFWPDRQGRGWRWEADGEDDCLLYRRDGSLAVHLNRQSNGWRVVHPRTTPEIVEPDLDAAKARAQTLALASLPMEGRFDARLAELVATGMDVEKTALKVVGELVRRGRLPGRMVAFCGVCCPPCSATAASAPLALRGCQ